MLNVKIGCGCCLFNSNTHLCTWKSIGLNGETCSEGLTNVISWTNSGSIKLESASQTFFGCLIVYSLGRINALYLVTAVMENNSSHEVNVDV